MRKPSDMLRGAVMGRSDTVAALEELRVRFKSGEITCAALRLFRPDGTWEDVAIGGDEAEQAEALANLRTSHETN